MKVVASHRFRLLVTLAAFVGISVTWQCQRGFGALLQQKSNGFVSFVHQHGKQAKPFELETDDKLDFINKTVYPPLKVSELPKPVSLSLGKWVDSANDASFNNCQQERFKTRHTCCTWYHTAQIQQQRFIFSVPNEVETRKVSNSPWLRNIVDLCNLLHSKRVMILGDSMSEQIYETLVLSLIGANISMSTLPQENLTAIHRAGVEPYPYIRGFHIHQYNFTLMLTKVYRLSHGDEDIASTASKNVISLSQSRKLMKKADVFIVNFGMHYTEPSQARDFHKAMHALGRIFAYHRKQKKIFLMRDMLPTYYQRGNAETPNLCGNHIANYSKLNTILRHVSEEYGLSYLEMYEVYRYQNRGKVGLNNGRFFDCVHYCHSGWIFEPIVNELYGILVRIML